MKSDQIRSAGASILSQVISDFEAIHSIQSQSRRVPGKTTLRKLQVRTVYFDREATVRLGALRCSRTKATKPCATGDIRDGS